MEKAELKLRLPAEIKAAIAAQAAENGRSLNNEIVQILKMITKTGGKSVKLHA